VKDGSKPEIDLYTQGASLSREAKSVAPSEMAALNSTTLIYEIAVLDRSDA
jgi:hypothetical protein